MLKLKAQAAVEAMYSRKNIKLHVKNDINTEHPVFRDMVNIINSHRTNQGTYYPSKNKRINELYSKLTSDDIVTEILTVILPIQVVSPIQALVAQLGANLGYKQLLDGIKTGAELLAICEKSGAFTIYHSKDALNDTGTLSVRANFKLDTSTTDLVAKTKYLPPMLLPPVNWSTNLDGGHLQGSGSCILGALNHHNLPQSLDVLNILQNIPWQLNEMVDYVESSNKELDTHKKQVQFNLMSQQSNTVYKELMDNGNKFYFVWKNDARGRMYSQGYHCNIQSSQYKKAILDFYNEEYITGG